MADRTIRLKAEDYDYMCKKLGINQGAEFVKFREFIFVEGGGRLYGKCAN